MKKKTKQAIRSKRDRPFLQDVQAMIKQYECEITKVDLGGLLYPMYAYLKTDNRIFDDTLQAIIVVRVFNRIKVDAKVKYKVKFQSGGTTGFLSYPLPPAFLPSKAFEKGLYIAVQESIHDSLLKVSKEIKIKIANIVKQHS